MQKSQIYLNLYSFCHLFKYINDKKVTINAHIKTHFVLVT